MVLRHRNRARRPRVELAARDDRDRVPRPVPPAPERDDRRLGAAAPPPWPDGRDEGRRGITGRPVARGGDTTGGGAPDLARRLGSRGPRGWLRRRGPQPGP